MSKVFYDDMASFEKLEKCIKKIARTKEEREELESLVDEIMHHRVLGCILDRLPADHHKDFLERFKNAPHDESLFDYLGERIADDVKAFIRAELLLLGTELLALLAEGEIKEKHVTN